MQYWEKWQNEALDAVHTNEWKPKSKKHVDEFTKQVDKLIQSANEAHFCDEMFSRLCFEELDHRINSIPAPHPGSFEWMFDDAQRDQGGLLEWLGNTRGDNFFWVTGKPGSGKTAVPLPQPACFRLPGGLVWTRPWHHVRLLLLALRVFSTEIRRRPAALAAVRITSGYDIRPSRAGPWHCPVALCRPLEPVHVIWRRDL
jgi:hypothetical protein